MLDTIRSVFPGLAIAAVAGISFAVGASIQDRPYYGTETNELLAAGFAVSDPDGCEVAYFTPDGRHVRLTDLYPDSPVWKTAAQ